MSRVVVEIRRGDLEGNTYRVELDEPRLEAEPVSLDLAIDDQAPALRAFRDGVGTMSDVGAYLLERLRTHPGVADAIADALREPLAGDPRPLYIRLTPSAMIEGLPWEALFAQDGFLSLDQRWPIARMGFEADIAPRALDFSPPLRVFAVLAAAGVEALEEWNGLFDAFQALPFPSTVTVFVAEPALLEHLNGIVDDKVRVVAGFVPPIGPDLVAAVRDARPNIVHVFSHGRVASGAPLLMIATRESWEGGGGDLLLEAGQLADPAARDTLWLATMNCCKGAQAAEAGSLVYGLLKHGFPAVAGMREAIGESDANAFSRAFYRALVGLIAPLAGEVDEVDLDLARALHAPRQVLCDLHRGDRSCREAAPDLREWTLPVLYVRSGGIRIRFRGAAPAPADAATVDALHLEQIRIETQLQLLRKLIENPAPGTPEAVLELIRPRVTELEDQLAGRTAGPAGAGVGADAGAALAHG
jgi:hypothetical protein